MPSLSEWKGRIFMAFNLLDLARVLDLDCMLTAEGGLRIGPRRPPFEAAKATKFRTSVARATSISAGTRIDIDGPGSVRGLPA